MSTWRGGTVGLLASALLLAGCATTKTSNTARTATEQLLITNAVDQALDKVDFSPVYGHAVYIDDKYVDCVDKSYVIASLRHRILKSGGRLASKPEQADVVFELRAGAVGTNTSESFVGVPEITLPGMLTLPEVRFVERKSQQGIAKLGVVAYDPHSGTAVGTGGVSLAQSDDSNWYLAGMGPIRSGSVRQEIQQGTTGNAALLRDRLPPVIVLGQPPARAVPAAELAAEPEGGAVAPTSGKTSPTSLEGN